jgi:hypothetical protein
LSLKLSRE